MSALRFKAFEKEYLNTPGVMAIVEEPLLDDTILVYLDRETYQDGSIPKLYQEAHIDLIDAREQHSALSNALEKIKEHYNDEAATPVIHFTGMIDFIKTIIDIYDADQEDKQGEKQ